MAGTTNYRERGRREKFYAILRFSHARPARTVTIEHLEN